MPAPHFAFPNAMRLKRAADFARIRAEGKRRVCGSLIANWRELPDGAASQLGVVTSRKIGSAVVRSRARRLMRECFRRRQHDLRRPVQMVLVARASIAKKKLAQVEQDFLAILREAHLVRDTE